MPALSNANAAAAKAVAVAVASLAMAMLVYVVCAVPVSAIGVSAFVAKAVCAGQSRLTVIQLIGSWIFADFVFCEIALVGLKTHKIGSAATYSIGPVAHLLVSKTVAAGSNPGRSSKRYHVCTC